MNIQRPIIRESDYNSDLPHVRALFQEYARGLGVDLTFQGFAAELAGLPGCYAPPSGGIFIADVHGAPIGVIALREIRGVECEIKRLYIRPAFRGLGLATALAELTMSGAKNRGYRYAYLDTLRSMKAAIAVYERLGFQSVEPYYNNPLPEAVYFRKELNAD